ncbi:MAG: sodium-dependent transporter [candidate division Zixibacteria bacterium]|jgi:SNF family Na+-dependent transporter|nr:sodium-dependent transporter [candidate division Zixibacteria bacterium]
MQHRERWATKIGLILAMAGNAVGLGNFLRFPVQAAQNGGGAFMIPYFVALLLLGIPLMWVEWGMGRYGGRFGHGSTPGMFHVMWKHPLAKYLGALGLFLSLATMIFYVYVESWALGFSFFSLAGTYFDQESLTGMRHFLSSYQGNGDGYFTSILPAYGFLLLTLGINFYVLYRGVSKGIERLALIAMPALILFAIILVIRVIWVGTPDPVNHPDWTVESGFAFIWNPNLSQLSSPKVWLAAAGQIFFTLSLGSGLIQTYASYVRENEDIALGGLATASINEGVEVVLGASIAIPIAAAFFGLATTQEIAARGSYDLGFVSMPIIFSMIPMGQVFGFLWFLLLFFAGITSSVAMSQPLIAFLKEEFDLTHKKAVGALALMTLIPIQFVVFMFSGGFLDEMDYWVGTFGLVVFALFEVIVFAWLFGIEEGWNEITRGAEVTVPRMFRLVIKYITPLYLLFIMVNWIVLEAVPTLLMQGVPGEHLPVRWFARGVMLLLFIIICYMVYRAWKRRANREEVAS